MRSEIFIQIAGALDAAHEQGIVHRDLKPENVMLMRAGKQHEFVKVLDFGIAKVKNAAAKLTQTGLVFGTPHYMSPEQAAGQPVDHRSDIYSLGVIMYQMLAGQLPFAAETLMALMTKHMFEPAPSLREIGQRCRRCSMRSSGVACRRSRSCGMLRCVSSRATCGACS